MQKTHVQAHVIVQNFRSRSLFSQMDTVITSMFVKWQFLWILLLI